MQRVTLRTPYGTPVPLDMITEEYQIGSYQGMPEVCPLYDHSAIEYIAECSRERIRRKYDTNIMYSGRRRRGKSTVASHIALAIDPNLSVDQVSWDTPEFNALLHAAPYADPEHGIYPQVILDEAGYVLYTKNWMQEVQKSLVLKFQVVGVKRLITHFVLPHRKKLATDIREDVIEYWVYVTEREGYRGIAELRQGVENKWEPDQYWRPLLAFTFDELTGPWWDEYSRRKIAFVDSAAAKPLTGAPGARQESALRQRDAAIRALYTQTHLSHAKIGEALGIPRTTVDSILGPKKQLSV